MATKQPQPSASYFKQRTQVDDEGEILELSSGAVVRVRRPSIPHLVNAGIVPASLAGAQFRIQTKQNIADEDVKRIYDLELIIAQHAVIEPKVLPKGQKPNYEKGEISINDLKEGDLTEIYTYVQGGVEALDRFRGDGQGVSA